MSDKVIPVKVALRIRPLNQREKSDACTECLRTISGEPQVILGKDKPFTYDFVFSQQTPQIDIYESSVKPLLDALFKGYNATVLAYGQTGSGKTYTMGSGYSALSSATATLSNNGDSQSNNIMNINDLDDVGVIPRVLNDLFAKIEDEQRINKESKFNVKVSFVEVYNEEIKDLFNLRPGQQNEPLNIREENNTIRVANLSEINVSNAITTIQLLERGSSMRVVGGTAMNDQSSRSHAIFTITLEQTRPAQAQSVPSDTNNLIKSKFHLVDLAGSERQSKTKAEGLRLKEGININLGLLALGNVISVLGEDNPGNKIKHVPYRESKLTRLLQDSLGGNSHTVMIACVSPADSNMEETLNTLRYADRARKIKNKPVVNIDPQAAELNSLRQQVQELKAHIFQLNGGVNYTPNTLNDNNSNELKEEIDKLKLENGKLLIELKRMINIHRTTYDRVIQLETENEDLKKKFEEIKQTFEKLSKTESILLTENQSITNNNNLDFTLNPLINELHNKLGEFEQIKSKDKCELIGQENEPDINLDQNDPIEKDYALRQAKMQFQLNDYDTELARKEDLFKKMLDNCSNSKFESDMEELKTKIDQLEKEKEELIELLRTGDSTTRKQAEQKRDRLKQLEFEVVELKKKEKENQKLLKLKEENEKNCEKLRQEIQNIKQERVKLIKQMRSDTETFRKFRQEKEKEVNQLKAMERKRLVEINKLQEGNNRQEAVLRRKNEEITRIQKQLRETLEKQKQVAEKRQQTFDRKDNSTLGDKLRQWVTQELDLSVSIAEARINLNKLIEERKESAAELTKLTESLNKLIESENPPEKKRKFYNFDSNQDQEEEETRPQLELKIERLKEEIECKSLQINEIQQMVIDGEQEDRPKHMFNNLHGILEAKVLLKHLYNIGVQYLLDTKLKQNQIDSQNQDLNDYKKKCDQTDEENGKIKKTFSKEINDLRNYYEKRIHYLLNKACDMSKSNDERYNIIFEELQQMQKRFEADKPEFLEPFPVKKRELSDMTNKDEFRRTQKIRKDHRRTRVIHKIPEIDTNLVNTSNCEASNSLINQTVNVYEAINECSPTMESPNEIAEDDKSRDPDWAKTPLRLRRPRVSKRPSLSRKSRSRYQTNVLLTSNPTE